MEAELALRVLVDLRLGDPAMYSDPLAEPTGCPVIEIKTPGSVVLLRNSAGSGSHGRSLVNALWSMIRGRRYNTDAT